MIGVALYRGVSPISTLIRWQTRSLYSHAAFIDLDTLRVFESWHRGGVDGWHAPGKLHTPGTVVDTFLVTPGLSADAERELRVWCSLQRGKGYDYRGVLRFATRRPAGYTRNWFCSALVFGGFAHVGTRLLARIPANHVAPGHLAWSTHLTAAGTFRVGAEGWLEAWTPGATLQDGQGSPRLAWGMNPQGPGFRGFCNGALQFCSGIGRRSRGATRRKELVVG